MRGRQALASLSLAGLMAAGLLAAGGCPSWLGSYLTAERTGNVNFQFINNTPFRASFSYGTWDALDKNPPGPVTLLQLRLAPNSSSTVSTAPCRRNAAIGTQDFIDRVLATRADEDIDLDEDAFGVNVNFSSAPADSDLAALPTEGTAAGREVVIGGEYSCGDRLVFTFEQDPTASGGFRIDFEVIKDELRNE